MTTFLNYMAMFAANFAVVFLLGLQSKNVQHSRVMAAVFTSFGISISQFLFVKWAATGGFDVFVVCAVGGCAGIACAIWFHDWVAEKKHRKLKMVEEDQDEWMRTLASKREFELGRYGIPRPDESK